MQGKSVSILHNLEKTEKLWLADARMHNACSSLGFFRGKGSSDLLATLALCLHGCICSCPTSTNHAPVFVL